MPQFTIFLLLFVATAELFASAVETIHSSATAYYELKDYSNSKQKKSGDTYGVGADVHYLGSEYKFIYEYARANTFQPPLKENLENQKIFLRYGLNLNQNFALNVNYINIIDDNIAITSNGQAYGLGLSYKLNKSFSANFTEYYSDYRDFSVAQSDLRLDYKTSINEFKIQLSSITKYLILDEKHKNAFTKNAQDSYLTTGVKIHSHYNSYHFGLAAYYGKRVFAIMNDGFKIQHHAMEFDRTYAVGVGKNISDFVLRFQYIYQRADEIPINNKNVEMGISRIILNYKF